MRVTIGGKIKVKGNGQENPFYTDWTAGNVPHMLWLRASHERA
jgi:hypothetical protein